MVAERWDVDSLGDIRIAQGEDLAVGHRRDSPASIDIPLTLSMRSWRNGGMAAVGGHR